MSRFSSNLPCPPSSRVPRGPDNVLGGQPPISSSYQAMVSTPVAAMNPPPNVAGLVIPAPSQGHGINEDPVTAVEPPDSALRVDKGKQPTNEGLQGKRKRVVSVKSDEFIPGEGLMVDARCADHEKEFFSINPYVDLKGRLMDVADHYRLLPFCLCLLVQRLNECLSKADWKDLRHRGQGLPSLCDTMVCFY